MTGLESLFPALLREYADRQTGYIYADEVAVLRQAADEIEALRERLERAAYLVENLVQQVPEFTGVVGPGGEREDDSIRDNIGREADEWREILRG